MKVTRDRFLSIISVDWRWQMTVLFVNAGVRQRANPWTCVHVVPLFSAIHSIITEFLMAEIGGHSIERRSEIASRESAGEAIKGFTKLQKKRRILLFFSYP